MAFKDRFIDIANNQEALTELQAQLYTEYQTRLKQDPRYTEIVGFLQGNEVHEAAQYLADNIWYNPYSFRVRVATQTMDVQGTKVAYANDTREVDLQTTAIKKPLEQQLVLPGENVNTSLILSEIARTKDSDLTDLLDFILSQGGVITFNGGIRKYPAYLRAGNDFKTAFNRMYLVEEVDERESPITCMFRAVYDLSRKKVMYDMAYAGDCRFQSQDELMSDLVAKIKQGRRLESSFDF